MKNEIITGDTGRYLAAFLSNDGWEIKELQDDGIIFHKDNCHVVIFIDES